MQPLAFRTKKLKPPATEQDKPTAVAVGLAYIAERLGQLSRVVDQQSAPGRLARLKEHARALELLGRPMQWDDARITGTEVAREVRPALDQMASEKGALLLWDVAPNPVQVSARHGRTIEAMKQLGYGAIRLLDVGGTLHIHIAPHEISGLCIEITANSFSLPQNWDSMHPGPNACPLPTGALSALRLALELLEQPVSTLGVRHYPSQSTLHFALVDKGPIESD